MRDDPEAARLIRGTVYLARLRVNRLEGAWPEPNLVQERAVRDARRALAVIEERAKEEGVPTTESASERLAAGSVPSSLEARPGVDSAAAASEPS